MKVFRLIFEILGYLSAVALLAAPFLPREGDKNKISLSGVIDDMKAEMKKERVHGEDDINGYEVYFSNDFSWALLRNNDVIQSIVLIRMNSDGSFSCFGAPRFNVPSQCL